METVTAEHGGATLADLRAQFANGAPFLAEAALLGFNSDSDYSPADVAATPLLQTSDGPCAWALNHKRAGTACYVVQSANGASVVSALTEAIRRVQIHVGAIALGPDDKVKLWEARMRERNASWRAEDLINSVTERCRDLQANLSSRRRRDSESVLLCIGESGRFEETHAPADWRTMPELSALQDSLVWEAKADTTGVAPSGWWTDSLDGLGDKVRAVLCAYADRELLSKPHRLGCAL